MGAQVYQKANWYNIAQGKLVHKRDDGTKLEFDSYEGVITSIKKKNGDYNGEPKIDVILGISDGKEDALISFNAESPYARGFFSRILNIDLNDTFTLHVMPWNDDGKRDKAVSLCWMKQRNLKIDPEPDAPNSEELRAGSKTVRDWTKFNEWTDGIVAELQAELTKRPALQPAPAPTTSMYPAAEEESYREESSTAANAPIDDLPF